MIHENARGSEMFMSCENKCSTRFLFLLLHTLFVSLYLYYCYRRAKYDKVATRKQTRDLMIYSCISENKKISYRVSLLVLLNENNIFVRDLRKNE